jgi:hypothetical protein
MKALYLVVIILLGIVAAIVVYFALRGSTYSLVASRSTLAFEISSVECDGSIITAVVKNLGTAASDELTVSSINPAGYSGGSCKIPAIQAGSMGSCSFVKIGGAGLYIVDVKSAGKEVRSSVSCPS